MALDRFALTKYSGHRLNAAMRRHTSLSEIYHENTKLTPLSARAAGNVITGISHSPMLRRMLEQPDKIYSLMDRVELRPFEPGGALDTALLARRSVRSYTGEPVRRDELARLLFAAYGRTDPRTGYRAAPSGGALYPLEWYVFAHRIAGLERGCYHYYSPTHALDVVDRVDHLPALKECLWFDTVQADQAAATIVVAAVFRRTTLKYLDRGYRLVLLEAGGAAQNMSLLATSMGLGACYIAGFQDDNLSRIIGVDGVDEAPLLAIVIGRPLTPA